MKILFSIVLIMLACTNNFKISDSDHQLESLISVYIELIHLNEKYPDLTTAYKDSALIILNKHSFTQEKYNDAIAYLNAEPERWKTFYQEVLERIKRSSTANGRPASPGAASTN